ncbi:MAG: hypothetical protein KC910_09915, partial [Candidatus Eremiobacteraeota bacterium]|nr:hypothetical protein [Candidatus Eremiobacteraeota bacterium]
MTAWLFPSVRAGERQRFVYFFVLIGLLLIGLAIGSTVAEALLLAQLGVEALPVTLLVASAVTAVVSALYSSAVGRWRHEQLLVIMLAISMGLLLVLGVLVRRHVGWAYPALFCLYWASFSLFYSHFYTLVSEFFDTFSIKRMVPLFGVGATLGELCGGLLSAAISNQGTLALLGLWLASLAAAAGWVLAGGGRLRLWNPRQPDQEAASGWSLKAGLGYLSGSLLGRSLAVAVMGMIVAMGMLQYLTSAIFVAHFPSTERLAAFLGVFLAVTNLLELIIGACLTPWLLRRFGVAQTNLIHPLLSLAVFAAIGFNGSLVLAMLAWMHRRTLQDALASPTRTLIFNAFPRRLRGRLRGVIQGVLGSLAHAADGLMLMLLQSLDPRLIIPAGAVFAAAYLGGALGVRKAYLATLVEGLGQGLEVAEKPPLEPLTELPQDPDPLSCLQLAEALDHPSPPQRAAAVAALAGRKDEGLAAAEGYLAADKESTVSAALAAVVAAEPVAGRALVVNELQRLVREAWSDLLMSRHVQTEFLRCALEDRARRNRRLAFRILELLEGEAVVGRVSMALRVASSSGRADALEVLSNLGDRRACDLLVLLLEDSPLEERLKELQGLKVPGDEQAIRRHCRQSSHRFLRWAAGHPQSAEVERLLALRRLELFEELGLEVLEEIEHLTFEEGFSPGRPVPSGKLYLILSGQIEDSGPGDVVGLVDLLDGQTAGSLRAVKPSRVLSLKKSDFDDLVKNHPEVALATFRWL